MAPYSMDLRERVARAWDVSGDAEEVAATFGVSRAWVHRLIQRRTNNVALMLRPTGDGGRRRCPFTMRDSMSSSTNRASRRICYAGMREALGVTASPITRRAVTGKLTQWSLRSVPRR